MRGQVFPWATFKEALLSFSQGKEVALRSRGGLRMSKNIIPVIMYKKGSGRIVIR